MSEVCPVHLTPWKTIPAGVSSKTGRPYNSFRRCSVDGCVQKPPRASNPAPRPLPQPEGQTSVLSDPRLNAGPTVALMAACLNFAARLYQGQGAEWEDNAKLLAKEMYEQWRARP